MTEAAPSGSSTGYALSIDNPMRVMITKDRGLHWVASFAGWDENLPRLIRADDARHARFLTQNAIYSTSDGGQHWTGVVLIP